MIGYVYIMTNPAFPNLVKIGKSGRNPVEFRAYELYTTGVPEPFKVEYCISVRGHRNLEARIHASLDDCRPNKGREFFQIPVPDAVALIRRIAVNVESECIYYRSQKEISDAQTRYEKEQSDIRLRNELEQAERERQRAYQLERRSVIDKLRENHVQELLAENEWVGNIINLVLGLISLVLVLIGFGDGLLWPFLLVMFFWWMVFVASKRREENANKLAREKFPYG